MKKTIVLLLGLALLLLTACGDNPGRKAETPERTSQAGVSGADAEEGTDESPEQVTAETEKPEEPETVSDTVTVDGIESYLRLTLPEGWSQRTGEEGIEFRPEADPDFVIRARFWDSFAMCGTGVRFEELELPGFESATLAFEKGADANFWTLILKTGTDTFTLQLNATQQAYDAHEAEISRMLESLVTGQLAQPQTGSERA